MSKVSSGVTLNGHRTRWQIHAREGQAFVLYSRLDIDGVSHETSQEFEKCVNHLHADGEALKGFWRMFRALEAKAETVLKPTKREDENLLNPPVGAVPIGMAPPERIDLPRAADAPRVPGERTRMSKYQHRFKFPIGPPTLSGHAGYCVALHFPKQTITGTGPAGEWSHSIDEHYAGFKVLGDPEHAKRCGERMLESRRLLVGAMGTRAMYADRYIVVESERIER